MRADYLVYTTSDESAAGVLYGLLAGDGEGGERVFRVLLGAEGIQSGRVFVGYWAARGRWVLQATGSDAGEPFRAIVALGEPGEGESVARLDIQCTLPIAQADDFILALQPGARYTAVRYENLREPGATLYVGSPASNKRLRVYNKTAQAGVTSPLGELVRVELQLRNERADYALAIARARGDDGLYQWWRTVVVDMAPGLAELIPQREMAHIDVPEPVVGQKRYLEWVERCVLPALGRIALTDEWGDVRRLLLRAIEAGH